MIPLSLVQIIMTGGFYWGIFTTAGTVWARMCHCVLSLSQNGSDWNSCFSVAQWEQILYYQCWSSKHVYILLLFCYAFKDKTVFTNKHFSFFSFSFWLCFILTQTLSPGRTLCWAVICYHILHLMETSLFLLSPPPAPLLLLAPARDPVWRSCRLVRQLPVRPPPLG